MLRTYQDKEKNRISGLHKFVDDLKKILEAGRDIIIKVHKENTEFVREHLREYNVTGPIPGLLTKRIGVEVILFDDYFIDTLYAKGKKRKLNST